MPTERVVPEFSRPIQVDRLPGRVSRQRLSAEPEECAALASRFRLLALDSLSAEIEINPPSGRGLVRVRGTLSARIVQACVVTLAPLPATVESGFSLTFGPPEDEDSELDLLWDGEDPPDPILDGAIDLGEMVAEQLALAIEPFPRAPGARFDSPPDDEPAPSPKASPFAALAALRQKMG